MEITDKSCIEESNLIWKYVDERIYLHHYLHLFMSRESNPRCSFSSSKNPWPFNKRQKENSSKKYLERGEKRMCLNFQGPATQGDVFYQYRGIWLWLVGGWTNPLKKNMIVKLDHFPNFRGENKKSLKPPPSYDLTCEITTSWCFLSWQSPTK